MSKTKQVEDMNEQELAAEKAADKATAEIEKKLDVNDLIEKGKKGSLSTGPSSSVRNTTSSRSRVTRRSLRDDWSILRMSSSMGKSTIWIGRERCRVLTAAAQR